MTDTIRLSDRLELALAPTVDSVPEARADGAGLIAAERQRQIDADLRRREPGAADRVHGLEHVVDQRAQFGGVEGGDRLGDAQQARVAHLQDLANGHGSAASGNAPL